MASSSANNSGAELTFGTVAPVTTDHNDNATFVVTDDGTASGTPSELHKFDEESGAWVNIPLGGGTTCPAPMTRAQLLALSGSYSKDCHYVITDYSRGTVGAASIELHAVDETTLSNNVSVKTTHDNMAWRGGYDINANRLFELLDNESNRVKGEAAVDTFPWGVSAVTQNTVNNAILTYIGGTVQSNTIESGADVEVTSGVFSYNTVSHDAQVKSASPNFVRNTIGGQSNVTINSGDFRENVVKSDAVVTSDTSGDVDNNTFDSLSIIKVSGATNVDTCTAAKNSNLTISGGSLADTTIDQDSDVTLYGGSHYENHFGTSTVFKQVAGTTAYVRYSRFEGTTTWTHGQVNISNVQSYLSTVNTTGSAGTISNSHLNRVYWPNVQRVASLTVTDSTFTDYTQVSVNDALRVYLYRCNVSGGSRVLVSAGATINASYTDVNSYSYLQSTKAVLTANYCNVSSQAYISNTSTGSNTASAAAVSGRANIRFLGDSVNCRVYQSSATGNASIYFQGSSSACYVYYCSATGSGKIYTNNSVGMRCYYSEATSNAKIYSNANTSTHYMYYLSSTSNSLIEMRACAASRMYSIEVASQSICRLQNGTSPSRLYYSSFAAYYYAYITLSTTRFGLSGSSRKTRTVTDPANGTPIENF